MEWWVKCVMRKFALVNSYEWACCTLVVGFNCIRSEYVFVIDVPQEIFKVQDLPISLLCRPRRRIPACETDNVGVYYTG